MTEIPEHLLKRSRERRSAIGQGGDEAAGASDAPAASSTPATTQAATAPAVAAAPSGPPARTAAPVPSAPPPPKPDPVYVAAAKNRKKIPFWAMATLSLMPIWGFMYVRAVTESPAVVEGPLGIGAGLYSACASCHAAAGDDPNSLGYPFANGSIVETFPHIEDQIRWVFYGTEGYKAASIDVYGNPDREGGAHQTGARGVMPQYGTQLSQADIVAVVCHERYDLGGVDPTSAEYSAEYDSWCAEGAPIFDDIASGAYDITSPDAPDPVGGLTPMPIGPEPVAGSAPVAG